MPAAPQKPMLYAELRPREVERDPAKMLSPYQGFLVSEKYDGWRGLWDGKTREMRTKTGKRRFQLPDGWARLLPGGRVRLDGEIYLRGEPATSVASLLSRPEHPLWQRATYRVFDIPSEGDRPFRDRVKAYTAAVKKACSKSTAGRCPFRAVRQARAGAPGSLRARHRRVLARGGEGLVLTDPESKYVSGRAGKHTRVKYKGRSDKEAVVVGHKVSSKDRSRLKSLTVHVKGRPAVRFQLAIGFSHHDRAHFREKFPKGTVVTYSYETEHPSGKPRHARFVSIRHAGQ